MVTYMYEVQYSTIINPNVIYNAFFYTRSDLNMFLDNTGDILLIVRRVFRYEQVDVTDEFLNKEGA